MLIRKVAGQPDTVRGGGDDKTDTGQHDIGRGEDNKTDNWSAGYRKRQGGMIRQVTGQHDTGRSEGMIRQVL